MRTTAVLAAALLALSLIGCTSTSPDAPTPSPATMPAPAASTPAASMPAPAAPTPEAAQTPAPPVASAPVSEPAPARSMSPATPSRACKVDADCAVKDVGSCCGTYPMCVNKDAKTDPAAVRAQCARDGMSSTCEVPQVGGCQCVKGQCANLANGTSVM